VDDNNNPTVISDDVVVTMEYTLTVDGTVVEYSEENDPLVFLQGYGNIVPGLERELYGMKVGDTKKVWTKPADGYGEFDPEAFMDVARSEFPPEIPLEIGVELDIHNDEDETMSATIVDVNKDFVHLDFNHHLAGKTLEFDIRIIDLRSATEEELEHGHAHGSDGDEEFEDNEFDDDFDELMDDEDDMDDDQTNPGNDSK